jgi:hypothetical protein
VRVGVLATESWHLVFKLVPTCGLACDIITPGRYARSRILCARAETYSYDSLNTGSIVKYQLARGRDCSKFGGDAYCVRHARAEDLVETAQI